MPRRITAATTLDNLRKEAKRWLRALRDGDAEARARFDAAYPKGADKPGLREVQHALAREYGEADWKSLRKTLEEGCAARRERALAGYEQIARDLSAASEVSSAEGRELAARQEGFDHWAALAEAVAGPVSEATRKHHRAAQDWVGAYERDEVALRRLNEYYERSFEMEDVRAEIWRRVYAFRQRSSRIPKNYLQLSEAHLLIAQDAGFGSWDALMEAAEKGEAPPGAPYVIDAKENRIGPRRRLSGREWDELIGVMKEQRIARLDANGLMTDEALRRIAGLDHVTSLHLGGSRELTDDGLLELARMPQLETLNVSEYPGGKLTDRGLAMLSHLPNLKRFEMAWQAGFSDQGVANLRACERLERVDLMGSPTGDGAIAALQGKQGLRWFNTGRLVTDEGLELLQHFPRLKTWHGPAMQAGDEEEFDRATRLLIDGPFTNAGLARLAGLDGVAHLDLFWHVSGITTDAFANLARMANLASLGCDGDLSDDVAMGHMAAIPGLRKLRAQESAATEEGFVALSRSKSLEGFWGQVCANFGSGAFTAFSKMPRLRRLGVGCENVSEAALASLPDFPALTDLTPIGFSDRGFEHIGRCAKLDHLVCMYCRETTDAATAHVARLGLKHYYAGLTKITDRSLEILGRMETLEQVELYECKGVTDAGLPYLAALPNLRDAHLDGLPGVTLQGTRVFPARVRVSYST